MTTLSNSILRISTFLTMLGTFSCVAPSQKEVKTPPLLSGLEMLAVQFKPGLPKESEDMKSTLDESKDFFMSALETNAETIKNYPHVKFDVVGFTDSAECAGRQCEELAARRAMLVYKWLISRGVSATSLTRPVGRGNSMPIDDNGTAEGRSRNRRVEINLAVDQ